ncbi:MAG TPA: hypothetical protein VMS88_03430, partial [Terriglobales bacterium]|nr:hypothetical protein [Terriglobales bacterium]
MDPTQIIVTLVGAALIVAVNTYFFRRPRAVRAAAAGSGAQEVRVRVSGAYEPSVIEVDAGRPVRLLFVREETEGCS